MDIVFTAVYRKVPEGYIGFVEELPGANTQGATLEEARENLKEAIELVIEANRALVEESANGEDIIREPIYIGLKEDSCELCGRPMELKQGSFGEFLACSGYPECRYTRNIGQSSGPMTA
jgi:predicted RNase H-like HicB family nuclease